MSKPSKHLPRPLFSKEPDFINDEGTRWWKDAVLTKHAERSLGRGYRVCAVQTEDDRRAYLLLDDENNIIDDDHQFEGMAYKIDKHELIRRV